jgi:hypothetical protein
VIIQPAPATQELADDLDAYLTRGHKLTPFEIKGLEKKAAALKNKISFADYYAFLGIIAAFSQDAEGVAYNFNNALKLAPTDITISANYLIALNQMGSYSQALRFGKSLLKTHLLDELIASASFLGRFHEAFELLSQLTNPKQSRWYSIIIEAVKIFDFAQLDDDEAEQLQQLAFSLLQDHKLYFSGSTIRIINDFIHYQIHVDLPIAEIAPLDFELSLRFAEKLENMHDDVILFEYKSVETLKR